VWASTCDRRFDATSLSSDGRRRIRSVIKESGVADSSTSEGGMWRLLRAGVGWTKLLSLDKFVGETSIGAVVVIELLVLLLSSDCWEDTADIAFVVVVVVVINFGSVPIDDDDSVTIEQEPSVTAATAEALWPRALFKVDDRSSRSTSI